MSNQKIKFLATNKAYGADEVGTLNLKQSPKQEIFAGDVGYLITGIKEAKEVKVGDTITDFEKPTEEAISGFEDVKPMVFAGMKIGLTTALIGAIVAEFAQATHGVGVLMSRFSFKLDMASSIATLLSMTLIGLILFYFMEFLDDKTVFWRRENRLTITSRKRKQKWLKANSL